MAFVVGCILDHKVKTLVNQLKKLVFGGEKRCW